MKLTINGADLALLVGVVYAGLGLNYWWFGLVPFLVASWFANLTWTCRGGRGCLGRSIDKIVLRRAARVLKTMSLEDRLDLRDERLELQDAVKVGQPWIPMETIFEQLGGDSLSWIDETGTRTRDYGDIQKAHLEPVAAAPDSSCPSCLSRPLFGCDDCIPDFGGGGGNRARRRARAIEQGCPQPQAHPARCGCKDGNE